jgi:hypothetical protein
MKYFNSSYNKMKLTKVIYLTFIAGRSSTTAYVNVPFKVKTLHTKAISLTSGTLDPAIVIGDYVTIVSDMVNNSPLGSTFNNSGYSAGTVQDIENQYWNPQVIQGTYNFTMYDSTGNLYPASTNNDSVSIIIEFNSPEEVL